MELLKKWHEAIETKNANLLDEMLADKVVFHSPVVWKPQEGKMLTTMYLTAAMYVLGQNDFHYHKEIVAENHACLEFTANIDGTIINGVDIITTNKQGKIIEFKVMVRPLKGMMMLKDKMHELMQKMKS